LAPLDTAFLIAVRLVVFFFVFFFIGMCGPTRQMKNVALGME
jgi:hypothetical protein